LLDSAPFELVHTQLLAACLLSLAFAGTTTSHLMADQSAAAADPLEARVAAYWEQRRVKDLSKAYEFYSAEYRSRTPREEFLKQTRLVRFDLRDISIGDVDVSGDRATVTVTYRMVVPTLGTDPVSSRIDEIWVKEPDGRWYKADETFVPPFPTSLPPPAQAAE
jgi:uncharacterized protein YlxW (UPF0749 family)